MAGRRPRLPVMLLLILALVNMRVAMASGHALLIGISEYSAQSQSSTLPGVPKDLANARRMAHAMGIEDANIVQVRDQDATRARIVSELGALRSKVSAGDRVMIFFSGHGTRYDANNRCVEGLQTYSPGAFTENDILTEEDLAKYTYPISERADKLITMIDACFSGGVLAGKTRSLSGALGLRAKFTTRGGQACDRAVNDRRTRSFAPAMTRLGADNENFVQIAAANYNEVSWDTPEFGGLATHSLSQCLLGEAKDLNQSGAISLDEIRQCAQAKIDETMKPYERLGQLRSTLQVRGSRNLIVVPAAPTPTAVTSAEPTKDQSALAAPPIAYTDSQKPAGTHTPTDESKLQNVQGNSEGSSVPVGGAVASTSSDQSPPSTPMAPALASVATLEDILAQRDPRLKLRVEAPEQLKIGRDLFDIKVTSSKAGYLYVVLLGSDNRSFYLLFPNKLDQDNRIVANSTVRLPRPGWSIKAGGPEGVNRILLVVAPSPRDPKVFVSSEADPGGPFAYSVADLSSRQRLIDFFVGRGAKNSDRRMGAELIQIKEVQ